MFSRIRFLFALAALCGLAAAGPADRITRSLDGAGRIVLKGHVHPATRAAIDRGEASPSTAMRDIVLLYRPSAQQQVDLDRLLAEQRNPGSPGFHQWLTPEVFAERFGLSPNDHAKVVAWLKTRHFAINDAARGRNWVSFSGTADQVTRAFGTPIHRYEENGKIHYANSAEPSLPAALAEVAGGFLGLNDFVPMSSVKVQQPNFTSGQSHYLAPEDFVT